MYLDDTPSLLFICTNTSKCIDNTNFMLGDTIQAIWMIMGKEDYHPYCLSHHHVASLLFLPLLTTINVEQHIYIHSTLCGQTLCPLWPKVPPPRGFEWTPCGRLPFFNDKANIQCWGYNLRTHMGVLVICYDLRDWWSIRLPSSHEKFNANTIRN
mgnify:CR=1 FL=1